jgi:hypothetical protein
MTWWYTDAVSTKPLTTEQLAAKVLQSLQQMTPQQKMEARAYLDATLARPSSLN